MPDYTPIYVPHSVVLAWARAFVAAGISVIPISKDGEKAPAGHLLPMHTSIPGADPHRSWSPFQTRLPTTDELECWYCRGAIPYGLGVVCGTVSGGLEAIDVDVPDLIQPWLDQVSQAAPDVLDRLVLVQTPRPGLHAFFRCPVIEGSTILAHGMVPDGNGIPQIKTLVETRGERSYVTTFPSPPECHKSMRMYQYMTPRTLLDVATISESEREVLHAISRSFNQIPAAENKNRLESDSKTTALATGMRPGDLFNARADWPELLERHGWSFVIEGGGGVSFWRRPGKSSGTSASLDYAGCERLFVFSSSAAPLEQNKSYSRFEFFAAMEHHGDFAAAAAALSAAGYRPPELPYGARSRGVATGAGRPYRDRGAAYRATRRH